MENWYRVIQFDYLGGFRTVLADRESRGTALTFCERAARKFNKAQNNVYHIVPLFNGTKLTYTFGDRATFTIEEIL